MQNAAWAALFRHVPAEQHNQYMLVTTAGTEIAVQGLLRIEEEFLALKGRLAGSQEAGRIFFVPYKNIDWFGTAKPVKDSEFEETFSSLILPGATCALPPVEPSALAGAPLRPEPAPKPNIRSEVLDRYRARPSSAAILPEPKPNGK